MTAIIDRTDVEEAAVQEAIDAIREMSSRKRLSSEEWRAFFLKDDMMKVISQAKFLRALGDCFTTKSVNDNLYGVLTGELNNVRSYLQSHKIDLTNSVGSDPLAYAESKIEYANDRYRRKKAAAMSSIFFSILLIIHLIVTSQY